MPDDAGLMPVKEERRKEDRVEELETWSSWKLLARCMEATTVTSLHNYFENYSFDSMDLCRQNDVSAF